MQICYILRLGIRTWIRIWKKYFFLDDSYIAFKDFDLNNYVFNLLEWTESSLRTMKVS
jgi:hypothetical protein